MQTIGRIQEMREIKFRVWSKIERKMKYYDRDCSSPNMTLNGVLIDGYSSNVSYQYELMQFTGLKDKNGKEIYEGDIVRGIWQVNHKDVREGVVNYWEKFGLYGLNDNSSLVSIVWSGCEVIGNIHENPELL